MKFLGRIWRRNAVKALPATDNETIQYFTPDLIPPFQPMSQEDISARFERAKAANSSAALQLIGMQEQKELSQVLSAASNVILQQKFNALSERRTSTDNKSWDEEAVDFFEFCIKSHEYYSAMLTNLAYFQKGFIDLVDETTEKLKTLPEGSIDALPVQLELEGYQDRISDCSHAIEILRRRFRLLEHLTEIYDKKVKLQINATRLATFSAIAHSEYFESAALGRALDDIHPERIVERRRLEGERTKAQAKQESAVYKHITDTLRDMTKNSGDQEFFYSESTTYLERGRSQISFLFGNRQEIEEDIRTHNFGDKNHAHISIITRDDGYTFLTTQKHSFNTYERSYVDCRERSAEEQRRKDDYEFKNKGKFSGRNKERIIEYILEWAKDAASHLTTEINQAMEGLAHRLEHGEPKVKALPPPSEKPLKIELQPALSPVEV